MSWKETDKQEEYSKDSLKLTLRSDRKLIRTTGSKRYIDFTIQIPRGAAEEEATRQPLELALVLDRSGSMQGEKMKTARQAVLAVLDQLTTRDKVAVVVFDSTIDIVQKLAPVTAELRGQIKKALQSIEARASTALHQGWLTGCNALAKEHTEAIKGDLLARCFLLTDGIANVGITDPEHIASEAAGIRENTGISTSTFGIGSDYNELLLGPMAVAGGGQFHHLRTADEIIKTFVGELGGLRMVVARQVKLEVEIESGMTTELISPYWEQPATRETTQRVIALGDLQSEDELHAVVRLEIPAQDGQEHREVRARLLWQDEAGTQHSAWETLKFAYANQSACDDEPQNADVMHWVGLHEVDQARREAIAHNNRGDQQKARSVLNRAAQQVSAYGAADSQLMAEVADMDWMEQEMEKAPMAPAVAKEAYYKQQTRSRGQRDYRTPEEDTKKKK